MRTKSEKKKHYNNIAPERDFWRKRSSYYYSELEKLIKFIVPKNKKLLQIGCGTGELLHCLEPAEGVGLDFSTEMIDLASNRFPELDFKVDDIENLSEKEVYDYIILSDILGELTDISKAFNNIKNVTDEKSRVVISYYNYLWEPLIRIAGKLKLKMPQDYQNWLSISDIENILYLNDFEVIKSGYKLLIPIKIPFFSNLINKYLAIFPFFKKLCLIQYIVAKKITSNHKTKDSYTVSVIVPCRNEIENIEAAVEKIPAMGKHTEIVFVDGSSSDGTIEKIEEAIKKHKGEKDIKLIHQIPKNSNTPENIILAATAPNKMLKLGKGDAVRKGFESATGEILMILDADLTVPPESLPMFYTAIANGKGEFINGTRLVYQMEDQAMRTLNLLGNKFFSWAFTWLLEQKIKDTLCGTKVLFKEDFEKIKAGRSYFGDFDPFGDFDLLFGAAKLNLKIVEVPIRYKKRTFGEIKIERFKHGLILLKMSFIALKKFKLS